MNIRYLWILMLAISGVLFLFQTSVDHIAPNGVGTSIYNSQGSIIQSYNSNGTYNLVNDPNTGVPQLPADVSTSDNTGYTDIFQSISTWFTNTNGGKIITGLYYGVPNILKGIGMPKEFSYTLGLIWNLLAMFSFVMFMRGVL